MEQQITTAIAANGASTPHDLFALTDEQILEIEPEGEVNVELGFSPASSSAVPPREAAPHRVIPSEARDRGNTVEPASPQNASQDSSSPMAPRNDVSEQGALSGREHGSQATGHDSAAPPPAWLAAQMKDPWNGEEAKELWNGVQQARQEAAAYRAAFATPEDARTLKELYPGGVTEARAAANRARLLDDIDRAYFGSASSTPEQTTAARTQLAAMMLREDPAAFREMVFAGLRALEEAEKGSGASANALNLPRLAQAVIANRAGVDVAPPFRTASSPVETSSQRGDAGFQPGIPAGATYGPLAASAASVSVSSVGAQHAAPLPSAAATSEAHVAAYAAFERAANEDLERSVGAAITHTLLQALPNLGKDDGKATVGARNIVPLQERLGAAVRQDVEAALKGDRQLGEQIAQILSARRFDGETRAQVVRLIDDRARQLVPSASKRVLNEWTQTTLAAHRGNATRADAASARREVDPAVTPGPVAQGGSLPGRQTGASPAALSSRAAQARPGTDPHRNASRSDARRLDYRKLSDEQILDL